MDWVSSREDAADTLLHDLSARAPHSAPPPDFSPLVTGLLGPPPAPSSAATEWPLPHVPRSARNDFRYEFSLSAGPEFDTDSPAAVRHDLHHNTTNHLQQQPTHLHPDDDALSTDFHHGTSTSEDTSVGVDLPVPHQPFPDPDDMSVIRSSPALSPTHTHSPLLPLHPEQKPNITNRKVFNPSHPPSPLKHLPVQKTGKVIHKKKPSAAPSKKPLPRPPSAPTTTAAAAATTMSAGTSAGQSATLSHTKMCRDRLNNMFERLRHTLPPAPTGVEVKHKAQVLDYAIAVLKGMVDRTSQLEIELAVSSNKATMDWISKLVNRIDTFPEAAEEVMKLFCRRRGWIHSELWTAVKRPVPPGSDPEQCTNLTFCTAVPNGPHTPNAISLEHFSKESESYVFKPKEGVQGRVWSSMRPEWVSGLADLKNFRRAPLARKYGLKACLAVPVTITGKIEAVMCFYDVKHRPYDTQCLELAMRLAWALGNAVGGKRAKVNALTVSGTSNT